MSDRDVTLSVNLDNFIFVRGDTGNFLKELCENVPPCFGEAHYKHKAGEVSLEKNGKLYICLKDRETYGYDTILGSVRPEDLKAFKKLYPGYHNQVQTTLTMSLVNPTK